MLLLYLAKWNALLPLHKNTKKEQNSTKKKQKSLSAYFWVVYTTAVAESRSWYKIIINASLTQNLCLKCVAPPLAHVGIPQPATARRHWTELWRNGMIKSGDVHYQTEPNLSFFSERDFINDDSSCCSLIVSVTDLQYHVFFLLKSFC